MPADLVLPYLKDSKQYSSETRRIAAYIMLQKHSSISSVVVFGEVEEIESKGIDVVQMSLYRQVLSLLGPTADRVVLDGDTYLRGAESIPKADATIPAVMAASVIAKVQRDNLMIGASAVYPAYGFDKHKGYGTKAHREAIKAHGLTPVHRWSFCSRLV